MILYVNGDLHTAGAHAVVPYSVAEDDFDLWYLGQAPHPANANVAYATRISQIVKARLVLDTETGGSTSKIIAGSQKFIGSNKFKEQLIVIIGWPKITPEVAEFHNQLNTLSVPHVFFSINTHNQEPFLIPESYLPWLSENGYQIINGYADAAGHQAWANHLISYLTKLL